MNFGASASKEDLSLGYAEYIVAVYEEQYALLLFSALSTVATAMTMLHGETVCERRRASILFGRSF